MLMNIQYEPVYPVYIKYILYTAYRGTQIETIPLMASVAIFDMWRTSIISRIWFCLTPSFSISSLIRRRSNAISWTKCTLVKLSLSRSDSGPVWDQFGIPQRSRLYDFMVRFYTRWIGVGFGLTLFNMRFFIIWFFLIIFNVNIIV